jgi:hypothetical protein
MEEISLPEPWKDVPFVEDGIDHTKTLEDAANTFRSYSDEEYPHAAQWVNSHWIHLHNPDTSVDVFMHLQNKLFSQQWEATSVYFSATGNGHAVSSAELRKLPLSTICSIYGNRFNIGLITASRRSALADYKGDHDAMKPLPKVGKRKGPGFYALVGMQFDELAKRYPDENIAMRMRDLNGAPLSTVQRWIAKARSMNMLAAAQWVKD